MGHVLYKISYYFKFYHKLEIKRVVITNININNQFSLQFFTNIIFASNATEI